MKLGNVAFSSYGSTGFEQISDAPTPFSQMNVNFVAQRSVISHWHVKHKCLCHTVLNVLTSSRVPALALLLCRDDPATVNVHAVSFPQSLCCANF